MSEAPIIELREAELAYRLARHGSSTLKELFVDLARRHVRYERYAALRGVSLEVATGEILGVVGVNGAGKSSLMKLIAGILPPTGGRVIVRGSVAAMIELGAGFSHELTGRENIVLYGSLLGREPRVMRSRIDAIADWGGITEFLDVPVRSYSVGMLARLAFSICTDSEPEVLLVDEIMAVGDTEFLERSAERMRRLIHEGTVVVLVSHDMPTILEQATRAIWLDAGQVRANGAPAEVVAAYLASTPDGSGGEAPRAP